MKFLLFITALFFLGAGPLAVIGIIMLIALASSFVD